MTKNGENIYKRRGIRREIRYNNGCCCSNCRKKYGHGYGKTYREAKQKVAQARVALATEKTIHTHSKKRRFACYCDEWLQLNRNSIKESTYVRYSSMLEKHIKPRLGGHLVQSLTSVTIEQFGHSLLYEEELAPKTVKDILTVLCSIIKHTVKQCHEPLQIPEIVYPKVPKSETRVLSREEQTRFAAYLLEDMDECKFGVLLSLLTGMRVGEVCALQWKSVSLLEGTVNVKSTMQRLPDLAGESAGKTKVVISEPKSNTSWRVIPLTDYTVRLCKTQWCGDPEAFVLTGERDRYIEPRSMQYKLKHYAKACGLEGVHFHTLRHTFATRCVEVDFEIKSLSEILGHSSPRITLERYVHSSMELKRSNMNKLAFIGC